MKNKKKITIVLLCFILLISIVVSSVIIFSPEDNVETPTSLGEKKISFLHEPTNETEKTIFEKINNSPATGYSGNSFYGDGSKNKFYYLEDEEFNFLKLDDFTTVAHVTIDQNQNERISFLTHSGTNKNYNTNNLTKNNIKADIEKTTKFLGVKYTAVNVINDSNANIPDVAYENFDSVTDEDFQHILKDDSYIHVVYTVNKDIQYVLIIRMYENEYMIMLTMTYDLSLQV